MVSHQLLSLRASGPHDGSLSSSSFCSPKHRCITSVSGHVQRFGIDLCRLAMDACIDDTKWSTSEILVQVFEFYVLFGGSDKEASVYVLPRHLLQSISHFVREIHGSPRAAACLSEPFRCALSSVISNTQYCEEGSDISTLLNNAKRHLQLCTMSVQNGAEQSTDKRDALL